MREGLGGRIAFWLARARGSLKSSVFVRNVFWNSSITVLERLAAVVQTVLIARGLGITEYGIYGLWFGTVGFFGSILGLQMGLTATVYLARYRHDRKPEAAAVIRHVYRYALSVGLFTLLACAPFLPQLSQSLFQSGQYRFEVLIGLLFIGLTIFGGVQDGILQGFEDFRSVSVVRAVSVFVTLSLTYPVAKTFGLTGILLLMLVMAALKAVVMMRLVALRRRQWRIPPEPDPATHLGDIALKFSLPSMLVSLLVGLAAWLGSLMLSRQDGGFEKLAVVNAGLQWRGAILTMAGSVGTVAIPAFSRHLHLDTRDAAAALKRRLLWLNFIGAATLSVFLMAGSPLLLAMYGPEFGQGWPLFCLLVLSTVPQVLANVYLQQMVGHGEMLRQLALHIPVYGVSILLYFVLIRAYGGYGYAWATLATSVLLYLAVLMVQSRTSSRN